ELTRKSLVKSRRLLIRKESRGVDARLVSARYVVSYRPMDGNWILGSVTGLLQVKVKSRFNKVDALFTASSELVVNDIALEEKNRIRFAEGFKPNYQMYEKIEAFDPDFWETSNIVLPDFLSKQVEK
ncbi:MAG: carboxypeptidase-like regulatory domain-containing protein, partial [Breznakibacter sp.]|nr:carboxypeptidase-like regulatory domain-containing protein [Breznakibacter sp.]